MQSASAELLSEYAAAWYAAIDGRKSYRAFTGRLASPDTIRSLARVCEGFAPFPGARVQLVERPTPGTFTGIVGSYGRIRGEAHALLVIRDSRVTASYAAAGFVGEAAVLHATALGIGSCWIGGAFSAGAAQRQATLSPSEKIVAVVALGFPTERLSATDQSMRFLAGKHRRRPVEQFAEGGVDAWPAWARACVDAALKAPSAVNRQPWRFALEDGGALVVSQDRPDSGAKLTREMDCGIAMMHIELAARSAGVRGVWELGRGGADAGGNDSGPVVARFRAESR